jgi:acyl-CoA reductase-like NAD-dependent aldehyde dehydrogenase
MVTKRYIGGEFVESHGCEVVASINRSNGVVIGYVTIGDAEDARRGVAATKKAFPAYSRTTKEERSRYLRRLHEAVSARASAPAAPPRASARDGDVYAQRTNINATQTQEPTSTQHRKKKHHGKASESSCSHYWRRERNREGNSD